MLNYYTYYSSFLFLLTSFYYRNLPLETPLALLSFTSTLHHSKFFEEYPGKRIIIFIDRALCHYIVALSVLYALLSDIKKPYGYFYLFMYYLCLLYTSLTYYLYLFHITDLNVHLTIHVSSCLGMYFLRQVI